MYTKIESQEEKSIAFYDFEIKDKVSRSIGASITTYEAVFVEQTEPHIWFYKLDPGRYYALSVHATRNGHGYGAAQSTRYFKELAERDQAIAKYLKGAKTRAAKVGK